MNRYLFFIAAMLCFMLTGCSRSVHRASYFVRPNVSADGNVDQSGNVWVHISNQGSQGYLAAHFQITRADGSGGPWEGSGAIEYDPIGEWVFAYALPPGEYTIEFSDGITDETFSFPWVFSFTVTHADNKVHLDLAYYLRERERTSDREPRLYEPSVTFEIGDRASARF